jgi:hypothetical protein
LTSISAKPSRSLPKYEKKLLEMWNGEEILPWREMERILRAQYFIFVRRSSLTDAEAARKLGLAPPNFYRMCKELGLK